MNRYAWWWSTGLSLALVGVAADVVMRTPPRTFAVLDVAELYRLKEAEIAAVLMRQDTPEPARAQALARAAAFSASVTTLLASLPGECGCLILARGAVVGSDAAVPDLTPAVRRRLGL